ncbi:hypothetical protein LCGC14_2879440, partial [marine sediment metagenome]
LALDLVPLLEKADRHAEADDLLAKVFDVNRQVCARFTNAASYHHDLATLAVGCGRRLDQGLEYAQRAVALSPENQAYLDTLGEIQKRKTQAKAGVSSELPADH